MQIRSVRALLVAASALAGFGVTACGGSIIGGGDDGEGGDDGTGGSATVDVTSQGGSCAPGDGDGDGDVTTNAASSGAGPDCSANPIDLLGEPFDECGNANCCAEMAECVGSPELCATDDVIDPSLPGGAALLSCLDENGCLEPTEDQPICDSGLVVAGSDPEAVALGECLSDSCCEEFTFCTSGGADQNACIDCLVAGGGPLCDAAIACQAEQCTPIPEEILICDSGLVMFPTTPDEAAYGRCLNDSCCEEFTACTANATDANACIDCLNTGSGPLCDAAIACMATCE